MFPAPASNGSRKYRSKRAVRRPKEIPTHLVTSWTKTKITLVCCGVSLLAMTMILPIIMLESTLSSPSSSQGLNAPVSLHGLIKKSLQVEEEYKVKGSDFWHKATDKIRGALHVDIPNEPISEEIKTTKPNEEANEKVKVSSSAAPDTLENDQNLAARTQKRESKHDAMEVAKPVSGGSSTKQQRLARGVSGLPMVKTPALVGASSGHVNCDVDVDDIVYWNDPQGDRDRNFVNPFATPSDHYLTFEPDMGGWNNIRMSMEIIFVMAAATGRTLVLPPKTPFYLLGIGKDNARSFGNFFPLEHADFKKKVNIITMEEFMEREKHGLLNLSDDDYEKLKPLADVCLHGKESPIRCELLYEHLREVGVQPEMEGMKNCLVFDLQHFQGKTTITPDVTKRVKRFCGERRNPVYYDDEMHLPQLIHWNAGGHEYRLLNHFYGFVYFTDPVIDNYHKRFVRDFLHYNDNIYCAAGKIVHALNDEGKGWSSLHVRRGDLQYKSVKIPAEEWYNNTKEVWKKGEIIFIATDERNKTFFDPIKEHHEIRFLDDYWDMAKLGDLESTYLGMVDTIVASNGRAFAGTWFSTFTGYINRMRGYLGHPMENSWYSWLPRKDAMQEWKYPEGNIPAREWPLGWTAIDGDEWIEHEGDPVFDDNGSITTIAKMRNVKDISLHDLESDEGFREKPVSRGVAGRALSETPALEGAKRGHITCDVNIDSLAYWNSPQGKRDEEFRSPFAVEGDEKYISFSVDRGGWNNVRMSMEIIFVIAAVTGRTLVLPPKEPLYRLRADKDNIFRGFADFFPLDDPDFAKRVKIISMEEFIKREGGPDGRAPIPPAMVENVTSSSVHCDKRANSKSFCGHVTDYLKEVGFSSGVRALDGCLVFDKDKYEGKNLTEANKQLISHLCGERKTAFINAEVQKLPLIHFRAGEKEFRLLTHFYNFIHFTDPAIANYYKRFVRDFLRYRDPIYCAAGKIVKALQAEAKDRGFHADEEGGGGYSALHVRRGDLQYKKVKIPAEEWYENTQEVWKPKEILYIATDERNKTFFGPVAEHHELRFLDDYFDLANLGDLDPNWFGMIDTIVASRGRAFAGTFFSTFTGYINRLRGYHGMSMKDSWYSFLPRKDKLHTWEHVDGFVYAYEWPEGWVGIDADVVPSKEVF